MRKQALALALSLAGGAGCDPYPIISGNEASYVRPTDELRAYELINPAGVSVSVLDALTAGAAMWDPAGARVRVLDATNADGPVVRAEMATTSEAWVDLSGDYAFAYYLDSQHTLKVNRDFNYSDMIPPQHALQVMLAHELGHAMGLPHLRDDQKGIMNASPWVGYTEPSPDDIALFRSHWRGVSTP